MSQPLRNAFSRTEPDPPAPNRSRTSERIFPVNQLQGISSA
jgi:hypothetical protein